MSSVRRRSAAAISRLAQALYRQAPLRERTLARLRPWICPFEQLLEVLPPRARVLDIGCGSGMLLGLAAREGRIGAGVGIDSSARAIASAQAMAATVPGADLRFCCLRAEEPWPDGDFTVVSLIDVMHHVQPAHQEALLARACQAVPPGGLLVYKDMARRPRWRALANRLHDLVMARQWIHYLPIERVMAVAKAQGLTLVRRQDTACGCYQHELAVLGRVAGPVSSP